MNKARKFCMNQYIWYICILPFLLTACDRRELDLLMKQRK